MKLLIVPAICGLFLLVSVPAQADATKNCHTGSYRLSDGQAFDIAPSDGDALRWRAFTGETAAVVHDAILNQTPAAVQNLNAANPRGLDAVITKALEKDRSRRYQSAAEMRAGGIVRSPASI